VLSRLQFVLIIWLQGIYLPRHGYSFADTPLWAGIYLLPLTVGFLLAGPVSGTLSDRYGARWFATGGLLLVADIWCFALAIRTVPLAELMLTKLQIIEVNEKDIRDMVLLLYGHDVADHDDDSVNGQRIAELCASDWGLWRTITGNLERCRELAQRQSGLPPGAHAVVVGTAITNPVELTRRFAAVAGG